LDWQRKNLKFVENFEDENFTNFGQILGTVPFFRLLQSRINKGLSRQKINFDTFYVKCKNNKK
jgi:hypothetical protein